MLAGVFLSTSAAAGCFCALEHVSHPVGRFDLPRDEIQVLL